MKLLHVIGCVKPESGGPLEGVWRQSAAAERFGHIREILSLDAPDDPWVAASPVKTHAVGIGAPFYKRLRSLVPWLRYGYTPHLVPWLRAHHNEYDVVIVNGLWNYSAFGTFLALHNGATPYVVFTHGMLDPWFRKSYPIKHLIKQIFWWFSEGRLMSSARAVLFTTEEERVLASNSFWPWRVRERVVGYGTEDVKGDGQAQIAAFRKAFPKLEKRRFLLFLSRIHPKKGCDTLIRAFARLAPAYPDIDMIIAGPDQIGLRRSLEELANVEGVTGRIHWPGMLRDDVKWGAYRAAEAFVLPSHSENFGIVVAEALACGIPVLITDKVNIWREVEASGAGLVSHDEVADFARILRKYFEMSDSAKEQMALNARSAFVRHFNVNTTFQAMLDVIMELKDDKPAR
jgi:glycosyltransferase involved in cell wall biosynthesis